MTSHAPAASRPEAARSPGRLEKLLRAGVFVATAETTPPLSADPAAVLERAGCLRGKADAVNVTDGAGARAHLCSLAAAAVLAREGVEPVLQFTMRDRNRLALEADLLGAAALGVPNVLCLRGDDMAGGDQPDAKMVHDLDSHELIALARGMRDDAALPSGRAVAVPPALFIGGADAPLDPPPDWRPDKLNAKIDAGADFFQTQFCFDIGVARRYMARLVDFGVTERAHFIIGIGPIASLKSARWMHDNLWGVEIPPAIFARLEGASNERAEGHKICVELMQQLRDIPGVAGVHLMGPRVERAAGEVIEASGLLRDRPALA